MEFLEVAGSCPGSQALQEKLQQLLDSKADDLKLQELEKDLISRPW